MSQKICKKPKNYFLKTGPMRRENFTFYAGSGVLPTRMSFKERYDIITNLRLFKSTIFTPASYTWTWCPWWRWWKNHRMPLSKNHRLVRRYLGAVHVDNIFLLSCEGSSIKKLQKGKIRAIPKMWRYLNLENTCCHSEKEWGSGTCVTGIQPGKSKHFEKQTIWWHFKHVTFSYDQCILGVVESGIIGLFSLASLSVYTIILWTSIKVKKTTTTSHFCLSTLSSVLFF